MTTTDTVEQRTNLYAKTFLLGFLVVVTIIGLTYYTHLLVSLRVWVAYVIPVSLIIGIGITAVLYRKGDSNLPLGPLLAGIVGIVGGASFDVIATVIKTPFLERETNPIARSLLDSGHSIEFMYVYGLMVQVLVIVFGCVMWAAFLRNRKAIIAAGKNADPKSYWEFLKAATGSGHLSWRQYFLPLNLSELPKSYYVVWVLAVMWVGMSVYRWYLGLEWLGVAHGSRYIVLVGGLLLSCIAYMFWLWFEYSRSAKPLTEAETAT